MKKILILVLLAMASFASAQPMVEPSTRVIMQSYDLAAVGSGSAIACSPNEIRIPDKITTVGSSATVSGSSTTSLPFAQAAVGDIISANVVSTSAGVTTTSRAIRVITVKGSNNSVTVNSAWQLPASGVAFNLIKPNCAAITNTTPWIDVLSNELVNVSFSISTINVTGGISIRLEGLFSDYGDVNPLVSNLWPGVTAAGADCFSGTYDGSANCNFTATTGAITLGISNQIKPRAIRLVAFIGTTDTGVNAINATLTEVK